jgi:hypothetical protein
MPRQLTRDQYEAQFGGSGMVTPDRSTQWTGNAAHPFWENYGARAADPVANEIDLVYSALRKLGLQHEDAVLGAQRRLGRRVGQYSEYENAYNNQIARMPLSQPLPQERPTYEQLAALQQMAQQAQQAQVKPRRGQGGVNRQLAMLSVLMAANPVEERPTGGNEVVVTPGVDTKQLPAIEAAVADAQNSRVPTGPSGRRMALRYGLPTLGALLGLYGLAALTDGSESQREYSETR